MSVLVDDERAAEIRSIVTLLDGVLAAIEGTYATAGVMLPDRRYWLLSQPVVDCEQVTVSFIQAYIGPPGDEASTVQPCNGPKTAVLQAQVHRCVPVATAKGRAPAAEKIMSAAEALAIDAFLLLDSANQLEQWDPYGVGLGVIATVEVTDPQGGFQGVLLNLTLALP